MSLLSRMSIRARLYFGTIFALVLLVIIGAMGYLALERTQSTLDVLFSQRVQTLTDVAELRTTLGDVRRAEKDIIISFNNAVEVGALRDSANAAKEIKGLIGSSVERVEGGARLVKQAGTTMGEIVDSVQRVTAIIASITTASAEQRDNVGHISQAVAHLDNMTQQNAALVEQSTAASESLREQAVQLTQAVSQFKL